jgi:uncharacterized protein (TIGR03067 family)
MRVMSALLLATGLFATVGCGGKDKSGTPADSGGTPNTTPAPTPGSTSGSTGAIDPAKLDGTYKLTKMYMLGEWVPDEEMSSSSPDELKVVIKDNTMTDKMFKKEHTQKIKTDPAKTPAEIDFISMRKGKEETGYGIYKVEGDVLTIAMSGESAKGPASRPKNFEPGKFTTIMVLKRQ